MMTAKQKAIFIKQKKIIKKIPLVEIYAIESTNDGDCKIYTYSNTYSTRKTLKKIIEKLIDNLKEDFLQINRSTIVRISEIDIINTETNEVVIQDRYFSLSRQRKQSLLNQLDIL